MNPSCPDAQGAAQGALVSCPVPFGCLILMFYPLATEKLFYIFRHSSLLPGASLLAIPFPPTVTAGKGTSPLVCFPSFR